MNRWMRRLLAAALCGAMALLWTAGGYAEAALGACRLRLLPDEGTCYEFDEVSVTTPASWKGKVAVLEYGGWAAFCHEKSLRRWQEQGSEDGGLLFALCLDQTTDFRGDPACQELGRTDRGYYYLSFPSDPQAYAGDEAVAAEYTALWEDIDAVRRSAEITAFHAGPSLSGEEERSDEAAFDEESAPYAGRWVPFEDGFRLYVPEAWSALEVTEAQADGGLFYRAGDGTMGLAVGYMPSGSLETREDLARDLESAGFTQIERADLNGIEAVRFQRPGDDYRGVAFFHPSYPAFILLVYVSPLGDPQSPEASIGEALLASVSPYTPGEPAGE